jgi:hypothetical protein
MFLIIITAILYVFSRGRRTREKREAAPPAWVSIRMAALVCGLHSPIRMAPVFRLRHEKK